MPYETQEPTGTLAPLSTVGGVDPGLNRPLRGFRFVAEFGDLGTSSFKSVGSGFGIQVNESEYREGGFASLTVRKVPGLVSYNDIRLEKGMYSDPLLYDWFCDYMCGKTPDPVQVATITVFDNAANPTAKWEVYNAWPKEYESSDLNADDSSILIETLTIAHEGIQRVTV